MKDDLLYRTVRNVLNYGMLLSFVLMLVGIILMVTGGTGNVLATIALGDLLARTAALDPLSIAALGVLALALTPGISVLASFFCFFTERDFKFALVCLGVLVILALSITVAL